MWGREVLTHLSLKVATVVTCTVRTHSHPHFFFNKLHTELQTLFVWWSCTPALFLAELPSPLSPENYVVELFRQTPERLRYQVEASLTLLVVAGLNVN